MFLKSIRRPVVLASCFALTASLVIATSAPSVAQSRLENHFSVAANSNATNSMGATYVLPSSASTATIPAPTQYVLEFNRSPVVGNRLRMEGIYDEGRLWFTRPRNWETSSAKVLLRFRHSGALYASRSNLTVLINGTSVGSVPMNQPQGKIGSVVFDVPTNLLQDYNEVVIAALQNNSPTCTQDPFDPSLWSEVLPDSKLVFEIKPKVVPLNFSQYPYPIYDTLSLEPNRVAYLLPDAVEEGWLTASARIHAALGRTAEYRALDSRPIQALADADSDERLVVIGTPDTQPDLASLSLPLPLKDGKWTDAKQTILPPDVGVLMLTTTNGGKTPILIASGNGEAGVRKAVQFLVQSPDRQIGTGNVIFVNELTEIPAPPSREWPRYLPLSNSFTLRDLPTSDRQPLKDLTVWGSHAPALEFDFRALPDDHFLPGSTMALRYSYGPQVNPLTSLVEVSLDGVALGGKRLSSVNGGNNETINVDLPPGQIKPNSKIQVNFRLDPRERRSCSRVTDQQLWGTIHGDSKFELNRETIARLPNLELLRYGYPFADPQDLSTTAIALPAKPNLTEIALMLSVSERLGRLSQSEAIHLAVHTADQISAEQQSQSHWIAIGLPDRFPWPEVLEADGFTLGKAFSRQWQESQIQTAPDVQGMVKQVISPWNPNRVFLALSGQTVTGLEQVTDLFDQDSLFYQIQGDTVLIHPNQSNPSPYDPASYTLEFLRQSPQRNMVQTDWSNRLLTLLRGHWFVLAPGILIAALFLYGVAQLYLKRLARPKNISGGELR
ncbi:MAG: cellulose biosynthesis cyclic di-GMP-binding regulatory protein BcsB [Elainella sp. Prado103]|nr:cellulose biosynthesis cyclic di-GMP-binding regulatory protein BcsB [Elainella sp. Prado103]